MATGRKKPRDPHAEKVRMLSEKLGFIKPKEQEEVLSAIMNQYERRVELVGATTENHMSDERSLIMFLAMQRLAERSENMDIVTLAGTSLRIAQERGVDLKLSPKDFADLRNVPPPADLESSVRQLDSAYQSRQIIEFALWAVDEAQSYPNIDKFLTMAQEKLSGIRPPRQDSRVQYGHDMADDLMANIREKRAARAAGKTLYINFPWESWNRQVGIHTPGKILLFAMPDGHGKSTYCVQMAAHTASRDLETFVIALEDNRDSVQARLAAKYANFPYQRFITGDVSDSEEAHIERMVRANMPHKLHFLYMPGASAAEILRELEIQTLSRHKPQAVYIDYLEAMKPSGSSMKAYNNDVYGAQGADVMNFVAYSSANGIPFLCFDQMRKDYLSLSSSEKEKRGRSMIAGAVDKSRASSIILIGENLGPKSDSIESGGAQISLWVDKANNSTPKRKMLQLLHGPTYTIIDSNEGTK